MAALALLTVLIAPAPSVQVLSDGAAAGFAEQVHEHLQAQERLVPVAPPHTFHPAPPPSLASAEALLGEAEQEYLTLNTKAALHTLERLRREVSPLLYRAEAAGLLAAAHRLRGLIHLYRQELPAAERAFVTASFLNPTFLPNEAAWPPEARLAYVDARSAVLAQSPGTLSVRVEPPEAQVFLDGQPVLLGSGTLEGVAPGEHVLTGYCPGYAPLTVVTAVEGGGRLQEASLFLAALPVPEHINVLAAHVAESEPGPGRQARARRLVTLLGGQHLVLVTQRPPSRPLIQLWNAAGEVQVLPAGAPEDVAQAVAEIIHPRPVPFVPPPPPPSATPWYENWVVWAIAGTVAAVLGGTTAAIVASQQPPPRITIVIGREP